MEDNNKAQKKRPQSKSEVPIRNNQEDNASEA
jgi:hypothetical protein